jgi:ureidoacrylate peracid hydrolase
VTTPVRTDPFAPASWELVRGRTVLLVIDPQNDFLHEDGWYAQQGIDISHMRRTVEPTKELVEEARRKGVPVVWTRHGYADAGEAGPFLELRPFLKDGGLRRGTWGWELYDEMDVRADDQIVEKNRLSGFFNTNLEEILRDLSAETVLIGGVLTNQCVAATSKDASFRDFRPIVVEECTGTTLPHLHDPAIEMMRVGWAEVRGVDDTISELRRLTA